MDSWVGGNSNTKCSLSLAFFSVPVCLSLFLADCPASAPFLCVSCNVCVRPNPSVHVSASVLQGVISAVSALCQHVLRRADADALLCCASPCLLSLCAVPCRGIASIMCRFFAAMCALCFDAAPALALLCCCPAHAFPLPHDTQFVAFGQRILDFEKDFHHSWLSS